MRTWKDNAAEHVALSKQGRDVRLALLVACSVERGKAGRPPKNPTIVGISVKVSGEEFAREADTSAPRVLRHLDAWNRLADSGLVKSSDQLRPQDALTYAVSMEAVEQFHKLGLGTTSEQAVRNLSGVVAELIAKEPGYAAKIANNPKAVEAIVREAVVPLVSDPQHVIDMITSDDEFVDILIDNVDARIALEAAYERLRVYRGSGTHSGSRSSGERDYSGNIESAVNKILVVLTAVDNSKYELSGLEQSLLYFLTQLLARRQFTPGERTEIAQSRLDEMLSEAEAYANTGIFG